LVQAGNKYGRGTARLLAIVWIAGMLVLPLVHAQAETPQQQIADQLCQVVNLVKYIAGAIAILAFAILGIQFMTVGSNPIAREDIKTKMGYIAVGMFIILVSNYIVAIFLPQAATCPLV
jgi:uncharacterized membrane protein